MFKSHVSKTIVQSYLFPRMPGVTSILGSIDNSNNSDCRKTNVRADSDRTNQPSHISSNINSDSKTNTSSRGDHDDFFSATSAMMSTSPMKTTSPITSTSPERVIGIATFQFRRRGGMLRFCEED